MTYDPGVWPFPPFAPFVVYPPYSRIVVGDEVDDSMERLHANVMTFGQALRDLVYVPGTWALRPGATSTDRYRFLQATWDPFLRSWLQFRSLKRDVPLQTLPGSGTASALRRYRARFAEIVRAAERELLVSGGASGYVAPTWVFEGR